MSPVSRPAVPLTVPRARSSTLAVLALACLSGLLGVGYEVLWTRHLLNLFGSTTTATASMLAAFMAGMALGAWAMARGTAALGRPLLVYAALELTLGLYGLAFGTIVKGAAAVFPSAAAVGADWLALTVAVRVAGNLAVLLLPTALMGAVLPALATALQHNRAVAPRYLAWLYGLNVLGGVIGAFGTGFVVLPTLGLGDSQLVLSALAASAAAVAAALAVRSRVAPAPVPEEGGRGDGAALAPLALRGALFLAGFAALGYEVLWTRILVLVTGSSTYAFALMLGSYLSGLALGGLWIGRHIDRLRAPAVALQHLQLAVALSAIAGMALVGYLPELALAGLATLGTSVAAIIAVNGSVAAALVLVPTFFVGAAFPVGARLLQRGPARRGRELGLALAWVSGGHVAGVLATAFAIVPLMGLQKGVVVLATVNLLAAGLLWSGGGRERRRAAYLVPGAIVAIALAGWSLPGWDARIMTSGIYRNAPAYLSLLGSWRGLERAFAQYRTRFYREGREAVVTVFERPTLTARRHIVLTIDGKVDASTGADMSTQLLSGYLPVLFRPGAERALVIGLASGVTVGALAQTAFERIDVVEIERAVIDASREFDSVSHAPLDDPRVKLVVEDGRQFLRAASGRFDVIVSEPSNPWLSASARLFTREFFTLVRERLAPRGLLVQWVPLYGLNQRQFEALLRTLLEVFRDAAVFRVAEGDLIVVASPEPLTPRLAALDTLFDRPGVRADLARAGVRTPEQFLALWVADAGGLDSALGGGAFNTDDNGLIEFGSPWYLLRETVPDNLAVLDRAAQGSELGALLARAAGGGEGPVRVLTAVARAHLAAGRFALARAMAETLRERGYRAEAALLSGDIAFARGDWEAAARAWRQTAGPGTWPRLGSLAYRRRDLQAAVESFERAGTAALSATRRLEYALALIALGAQDRALAVSRDLSGESFSTAAIAEPLLSRYLLARAGRRAEAAAAKAAFAEALDGLRRCLERDGCGKRMDGVLAWLEEAGDLLPEALRGEAERALRERLMDPLSTYYQGVRLLWLGEYGAALAAFERYLRRLPAADPDSKVHELIAAAEKARRSQ